MVNLKQEKQLLQYNAQLVVLCKIIRRFLLIATTLFQLKDSHNSQETNLIRVAEQIILIKPKDFREQTAVIDRIQEYTEKNFGLIIIDTFTTLYGAKVSESSGKAFGPNRELNRQLAILAQTAKIRKIPVIISSQVRSVFDEQNTSVRPVATRVLKFWADTIIALKPTQYPQTIKAVIEKTRETPHEVNCYVQIAEAGIIDSEFQE